MKKLTALFLTLVMTLSLAACGEEASPKKEKDTPATPQAEATQPKDEPFTEFVAIDNEHCQIKITGIDPNHMFGYGINAQLENKSADKTFMFSVERAAINGVESDPFFASTVAPGKKSNEVISFSDETLTENGIVDYTDIALTFRVYDNDDFSADNVVLETIHVYPYGEARAEKFVRQPQASDIVIIDNAYLTATVIGYEKDEFWGYGPKLHFINKTDKNIMLSAENASVNGFMADPYFAKIVPAGTVSFCSIYWSDSTLEENNITTIETLEFTLRAYDADDWTAEDFAEETIVLNP